MKNQYVGDIGDYGKYSLLRDFINAGVKIGVNWYLTENDDTNDGKFTDYLENKDEYRRYDPELFDVIKRVASKKNKSVMDIQNSGILPGAFFYSDILKPVGTPSDRRNIRGRWFEESIHVLEDADLIFMDPDNGLLENNNSSKLGAEKYVLPDEVEQYFNAGHNVVYYCHKGRRNMSQWFDYKSQMFRMIPEAKPAVLTYHKGSQRSYIFLIHNEDFEKYRGVIDKVTRRWFKIFTEEYTDKGDVAGSSDECVITLNRLNGTTVTISKRADGQLAVKSSNDPNCTHVISADLFCRSLGLW